MTHAHITWQGSLVPRNRVLLFGPGNEADGKVTCKLNIVSLATFTHNGLNVFFTGAVLEPYNILCSQLSLEIGVFPVPLLAPPPASCGCGRGAFNLLHKLQYRQYAYPDQNLCPDQLSVLRISG